MTNLERKGHQDLELPPGWRRVLRQGKTRDYSVFEGPGGRGTANSVLQAWREHGGDPAYMPPPPSLPKQPLVAATACSCSAAPRS